MVGLAVAGEVEEFVRGGGVGVEGREVVGEAYPGGLLEGWRGGWVGGIGAREEAVGYFGLWGWLRGDAGWRGGEEGGLVT